MTTERAGTGDRALDDLIRRGEVAPASDPGGVVALLAITPVPASDDSDTAQVISEQRADRL